MGKLTPQKPAAEPKAAPKKKAVFDKRDTMARVSKGPYTAFVAVCEERGIIAKTALTLLVEYATAHPGWLIDLMKKEGDL